VVTLVRRLKEDGDAPSSEKECDRDHNDGFIIDCSLLNSLFLYNKKTSAPHDVKRMITIASIDVWVHHRDV
jgi:hypothetical protein